MEFKSFESFDVTFHVTDSDYSTFTQTTNKPLLWAEWHYLPRFNLFLKKLVQVGLASIYRLPFCLKILTAACNYEEIKFKYISVSCLPVFFQKGAVK